MAPQNSTLIHGNAEATPTVSADEELSSYSPILPMARASRRRHASPDGGADVSLPPPPPPPNVTKSIAAFGRFSSRPEVQTSFSRGKNGTRSEGIEKGAVKRDSRNPITYYRDSANDTDEEEIPMTELGSANNDEEGTASDDEIEVPIWIRGEPRFVAGINEVTTCNNIIQALIDDELQNGNYQKDVAVSRDVNDYVITERWREVEQVLTGDTRILSIWNAWGDAKNEVQFRLKINKANMESAKSSKENKSKKQKEKIGLINRMMRKVLKQGEAIQNHLSMISQKSTEKRNQEKFRKYVKKHCGKTVIIENFLDDATTLYDIPSPSDESSDQPCKCKDKARRSTFPNKLFTAKKSKDTKVLKPKFYESSDQIEALKNEDELLLVIEHTSDSDSGIFTNNQLGRKNTLPKKPNFGSMVEIDKLTKEPIYEPAPDNRTPKRKLRTKRRYGSLRSREINRRKLNYDSDDVTPPIDDFENINLELRKGTFNRTSFRFDLIRQEISTKMQEMQQLLEQEDELLRRLKLKSAKFQAENQIYRSHIGLDFHVERLQESIDTCAKEIIEIEQDLLQTKAEIEEKSPLIDNLKALLEAQEAKQFRGFYSSYSPSGSTADSLNEMSSSNALGAMALPSSSTAASSKNSLSSGRNIRETEFVDNIYEFCDNNRSFVV